MPYLFANYVEEPVRNNPRNATFGYTRQQCVATTQTLQTQHPHGGAYNADDAQAQALVMNMGTKVRAGNAPHASDGVYVGDSWRMVSDNANRIRDMVIGELSHAHRLGLDIRSPVVIGNMYKLAVLVWSNILDYTGPDQDEGRR